MPTPKFRHTGEGGGGGGGQRLRRPYNRSVIREHRSHVDRICHGVCVNDIFYWHVPVGLCIYFILFIYLNLQYFFYAEKKYCKFSWEWISFQFLFNDQPRFNDRSNVNFIMGVSGRTYGQSKRKVGKKSCWQMKFYSSLDSDKITNKSCVTQYSINIGCSTNEL